MFQRDHDYFDKLFFDCACLYLGYETGKAKIQVGMTSIQLYSFCTLLMFYYSN